jgi:hypothetical protein
VSSTRLRHRKEPLSLAVGTAISPLEAKSSSGYQLIGGSGFECGTEHRHQEKHRLGNKKHRFRPSSFLFISSLYLALLAL